MDNYTVATMSEVGLEENLNLWHEKGWRVVSTFPSMHGGLIGVVFERMTDEN
jgi:hypothetical protein